MNLRPPSLLMTATALLGVALSASSPALHAQGAGDPSAFLPGAGVDTVQAKCAACHPATMITTKHFSAEKWAEVVDQMISKGAQVGDDDYQVIVTYLAKAYGEQK